MKVAVVHGGMEADGGPAVDPPDVAMVCKALDLKGHTTAKISADDGLEGVMLSLRSFAPDVVVSLVDRRRGPARETPYPALFAELRLAYTGSAPPALMVAADKHLTKMVARENGVPVPPGCIVTAATLTSMQWTAMRLPAFVKPAHEEQTRGIGPDAVCRTPRELEDKVRSSLTRYEAVVVEDYLPGTDLVVPYLEGVGDGVLPPCEVLFQAGSPFRHVVWGEVDTPALRCPAIVPEPVMTLVKAYVKRLVRVMGLRDFAQFDFRLTPDGVPFLLEVNAVPELSPGAPFLVSAERRGLTPADVVQKLVESTARRRRLFSAGVVATAGKERKGVRVGFVYNLKRVTPTLEKDSDAEFDAPKTINAIRDALERLGNIVVPLEANETLAARLGEARVDVVFNIAEGWRGRTREAQVPALCDLLGIPHTGSDATSLAVAMDKAVAKDLFLRNGIPTPVSQLFRSARDRLEPRMLFPLIVKPNAEGSSKGITGDNSVATNEDELRRIVKDALDRYKQPVLVEQYVSGREFTVALFQSDSGFRVLPPLEICFLDARKPYPVYSYEIKQDWDKNVRYDCPAIIDKRLERTLASAARKAFLALGCRDYARVDIRLGGVNHVPYVLEVNPLPGLTPNFSDMCLIAKAAGISYDELIAMILRYSVRRARIRPLRWRNGAVAIAGIPTAVVLPSATEPELPLQGGS